MVEIIEHSHIKGARLDKLIKEQEALGYRFFGAIFAKQEGTRVELVLMFSEMSEPQARVELLRKLGKDAHLFGSPE